MFSGFSTLPFAAAAYYFPQVRKKLLKMLEERYDLVHFESFYPAVYLPFIKNLGFKTLMGNENVEYRVYQRFVGQRKFLPLKLLLAIDVFKMRRFEEQLWRVADANIAPSKEDANTISGVTNEKCFVIPNGVDTKSFSEMEKLPHRDPVCLFVGDFTYVTNQDAVRWLAEEILPNVKYQMSNQCRTSNIKFLLVGRNPVTYVKSLASENIIVDDTVEDIREAYARADIFLAPIRIGGGTRIKILEAMAAGLPVVSTTVGAEGLEVNDGENILLADEPQEFTQKVISLLKSPSLRDKIGNAGRALVRQKYDWKQSVQKLQRVYASLS